LISVQELLVAEAEVTVLLK